MNVFFRLLDAITSLETRYLVSFANRSYRDPPTHRRPLSRRRKKIHGEIIKGEIRRRDKEWKQRKTKLPFLRPCRWARVSPIAVPVSSFIQNAGHFSRLLR